jgi:hypothetical protein
MFVSTKYLSLMEFVPRPGRRPLKVETFPEARKRPSASLVECLPFAHDRFEPIGQKCADRAPFFGCHDTRLSEKIGVELERDVRLHGAFEIARAHVRQELEGDRAAEPEILGLVDLAHAAGTQRREDPGMGRGAADHATSAEDGLDAGPTTSSRIIAEAVPAASRGREALSGEFLER